MQQFSSQGTEACSLLPAGLLAYWGRDAGTTGGAAMWGVMVDLEKETRRWEVSANWWLWLACKGRKNEGGISSG